MTTATPATADFLSVTELAGAEISREQLERMCHRYYWAAQYCDGKDVLEVACGAGQGLSYLRSRARSVSAGDYSPEILARPAALLKDQIDLRVFDAQQMPYADQSFDVVILFEALYYLPSAERFVREARRVLRPNGVLLIASANKDLYDFNPSPHSFVYFGVVEMRDLLTAQGFQPVFQGYLRTDSVSIRQRLLRPLKAIAVKLNLVPKTMTGKRILKRLVFGEMTLMPEQITADMLKDHRPPAQLSADAPDRVHKVIYCAARLL